MSLSKAVIKSYSIIDSYLWRRVNRKGTKDSVRILILDLGDEQGAHAGAGATTKGVSELEALKTFAVLGLLPHNIEDRVDELNALCVVALGPVVASAARAEDKVVLVEDLAEGIG